MASYCMPFMKKKCAFRLQLKKCHIISVYHKKRGFWNCKTIRNSKISLFSLKATCSFYGMNVFQIQTFAGCCVKKVSSVTVMLLNFRTDSPMQTVQTQIRLHCLPFCLHVLDSLLYERATLFTNFGIITAIFRVSKYSGVLRYSNKIWNRA